MREGNLGTVIYTPGTPFNEEDLLRYVNDEFSNVADAIQRLADGHLDQVHVEPLKPRLGDIRFADGTNWDPGCGEGVYVFNSLNEWELMLAKDVFVQDQHTEIIDLHMSALLSTLTLTAGTAIDDLAVTGDVEVAFVPLVGNLVCLKEGTSFYQAEILVAVNNAGDNWTLTLDTPLDFAFTVAGGCSVRNQDMNVDGSITTQIFSLSPANLTAGIEWDVTRVIFVLEDQTSMDSSLFGGLPALTNGIVLRSDNSITKNVFNVKTNGDFAAHSYDISYDDRAPAGFFGLRVRTSFSGQAKRGVTIRLTADTADEIQLLIQDDLTTGLGLTKFHCVVQGHVVDP